MCVSLVNHQLQVPPQVFPSLGVSGVHAGRHPHSRGQQCSCSFSSSGPSTRLETETLPPHLVLASSGSCRCCAKQQVTLAHCIFPQRFCLSSPWGFSSKSLVCPQGEGPAAALRAEARAFLELWDLWGLELITHFSMLTLPRTRFLQRLLIPEGVGSWTPKETQSTIF